jgi:hypothetical protein
MNTVFGTDFKRGHKFRRRAQSIADGKTKESAFGPLFNLLPGYGWGSDFWIVHSIHNV